MRRKLVTKTLAAADDDGISASASPGAGAIAIDGALASGGVATLDTGRRVIITSGGNDTGIVFTVTGKNENGVVISETITGANGGAATGVLDFKTVTAVSHTGVVAGTVKVGTNGVGATPWIPLDNNISPFNVALFLEIDSGKTVNATVEYTPDDVQLLTNVNQAALAIAGIQPSSHPSLSAKTASTDSNLAYPAAAVRLKVNSGTDPAKLIIRQAGV